MYYKIYMSNVVVKVENLSKVYKLYNDPVDRLKEALNPFRKKYHHDFYALKDISFEVKKGETIGIIGKNGSGKSTLLKILTGVLTPSAGNYYVNGKISSLLELGAGFNPELSGLENVYFNGAILGYTREEMDSRLDAILEFADIGEFINQPVKMYSSGMAVRLAFAVAISVDPDVLIVDEALAVGDIRFQQKCFRKFREFQEKGKTILLVTHDLGAVYNYCTRAIWLSDGGIIEDGLPEEVCKNYTVFMSYGAGKQVENVSDKKMLRGGFDLENKETIGFEEVSNCSSFGSGGAGIEGISLCSEATGQKIKTFKGGNIVNLYVRIRINEEISAPIVGFLLKDRYGNEILGFNSYVVEADLGSFKAGETVIVKFQFEFPFLKNGDYSVSVAIAEGTQSDHVQHHWVHDAYVVKIINDSSIAQLGAYFIVRRASVTLMS